MRTVGERFPAFRLQAVVDTEPGREFREVTEQTHAGKWQVVFYWPMDFTFVCPTEIAEFGRRTPDFRARGAEVLGASTDTHYVHLAWRRAEPSLRDLSFASSRRVSASIANGRSRSEGSARRHARWT